MAAAGARSGLDVAAKAGALSVAAFGRWTLDELAGLEERVREVSPAIRSAGVFDAGRIEALDSAGAWLIDRLLGAWRARGFGVDIVGLKAEHATLLRLVAANDRAAEVAPDENILLVVLMRMGRAFDRAMRDGRDLVAFNGAIVTTAAAALVGRSRLRFVPTLVHLEQVGFNALPIVSLISFLIGVVMAYQGASQLQKFGAEIFVVDLVGVSVLREIGILLTAIVVAGRSGSAFTSQIGSMKMQQEIDALRVIGIDPIEALVLPRVAALVLGLPLLAVFADIMGLLGGAVMAWGALGITPLQFVERLGEQIGPAQYFIGIAKAPVFAYLIALVGCRNGFNVKGSAASLGRLTTRSVVESIFLVIVLDAAFSIVLAALDL
jgi:phospholipid/cholesterol/gamma-HCH transport system permease protein